MCVCVCVCLCVCMYALDIMDSVGTTCKVEVQQRINATDKNDTKNRQEDVQTEN